MLGRSLQREERAITNSPWGDWSGQKETYAGPDVDSRSALQLLTVYGCTRMITDQISTMPLGCYRKGANGERIEITKPAWLEHPMVGIDFVTWVSMLLTSLLLDGNAFYVETYDSQGRILELIPLDPKMVRVTRVKGERVYLVNGAPLPWPVHCIQGITLPGHELGMSPIDAARESIGAGMAAQEYSGRFFRQGASLSGVIEMPGQLTAERAREIARQFYRRHSGKNAHLPGVLDGGATWKSAGVTPEQAQFLQTRGFTAAEIAGQLFMLDPSDLGIPVAGTSLTYANLEQRNARRLQVALLPWIVRLEHSLSALLAQPRYVKFNADALVRGDLSTRYAAYGVALASGFLTVDEVRQLEDLPPMPAGAAPMMPAPADQTPGAMP